MSSKNSDDLPKGYADIIKIKRKIQITIFIA